MNPARGFIIGIARKFCNPLIERTKCNFTAPPCWPSNMLKILPAYPQMIYSYVKNTRSLRLTFAMIFSNFLEITTCPRISILLLLLLLFLFGKATAFPQRDMAEFSVDPSLKYPYPVQWLFKNFVFKCLFKIWHKTAPFSTRSIMKPRKCGLTPTFRKASLA